MQLIIEKVIFLKSVDIFSEIPEESLVEVASSLTNLHVNVNNDVFKKGDLGTSMYIVVSGKIRLHENEKTQMVLGEKEIFGLLAALDPEPRMVSATATEPTHLFRIERGALYDLMSENMEITKGIIHALCERIRTRQR